MKEFNKQKGVIQEEIASKFVVKNKRLKILEQNYRTRLGEIDIIAMDRDKTIVFVEVKYRKTGKFGLGREAVDDRKIAKIRNVATQFLIQKGWQDNKVRFDVIDILDDKITYIDNAF